MEKIAAFDGAWTAKVRISAYFLTFEAGIPASMAVGKSLAVAATWLGLGISDLGCVVMHPGATSIASQSPANFSMPKRFEFM